MITRYLLLILLLVVWPVLAEPKLPINLSFELAENELPLGWKADNAAVLILDKQHKINGQQSLKLRRTSEDEGRYTLVSQPLPFSYAAKQVTLKGFIRTEQVEGTAVLLLQQFDAKGGMLNIADTRSTVASGTADWQAFSVTAEIAKNTAQLTLALGLVGQGQAWFDQLDITVDDKPLAQAVWQPPKVYPATQDKAFENGSGLSVTKVTEQQRQNLVLLAKVWGFVKYHHPASVAGDINMDAELFRIMPEILAAAPDTAPILLVNWISKFGKLLPCSPCRTSKSADTNIALPDSFWMQWSSHPALAELLQNIYQSAQPAENYWVTVDPMVGNPLFNEQDYAHLQNLDSGYRLLALFRFWNMIYYAFPYRELTTQPWEQVLEFNIIPMLAAAERKDFMLAIAALLSQVKDAHVGIRGPSPELTEFFGKNTAPLVLRFAENQAVVYALYPQATALTPALQVGDVVTAINGIAIDELVSQKRQYIAASNEPAALVYIAGLLLRSNEQQMTLTVKRAEKLFEVNTQLYPMASFEPSPYFSWRQEQQAYRFVESDIGYVALDQIKGTNLDAMMTEFSSTKGIIIDIRNYPSEFVVFSLGRFLYPKPYPFVKFSALDLANPGHFTYTPTQEVGEENPGFYQGKLVLLVNEFSVSQAEYTAMAFRGAPGAVVIGSNTAGSDGNVSPISLPGGIRTGISGIGVFYPDGRATQQIGIVPDIVVKPTIAGIRDGRDEVLDYAVSYIQQAMPGKTRATAD